MKSKWHGATKTKSHQCTAVSDKRKVIWTVQSPRQDVAECWIDCSKIVEQWHRNVRHPIKYRSHNKLPVTSNSKQCKLTAFREGQLTYKTTKKSVSSTRAEIRTKYLLLKCIYTTEASTSGLHNCAGGTLRPPRGIPKLMFQYLYRFQNWVRKNHTPVWVR